MLLESVKMLPDHLVSLLGTAVFIHHTLVVKAAWSAQNLETGL
jgi:hypothetical protein